MTVGALSGLGRTRLSSTISVILTGSRIPLALILTHAGMGLKWCMVGAYNLFYREGNRVYTDIPAYQQAVA